MIKLMREEFDVLTGLSDHTIGNEASMAAISLGAVAIEKHFTLDRQKGGEDSAFSIEPLELSSWLKSKAIMAKLERYFMGARC